MNTTNSSALSLAHTKYNTYIHGRLRRSPVAVHPGSTSTGSKWSRASSYTIPRLLHPNFALSSTLNHTKKKTLCLLVQFGKLGCWGATADDALYLIPTGLAYNLGRLNLTLKCTYCLGKVPKVVLCSL
jgi:hypothetical protein